MGRSAKVHKRVSKKTKSSSNASTQPPQKQHSEQIQASKKKATLKESKGPGLHKEGEHVLGGADYVSLMMGGRKKAREEGAKLPRGD